MPLPPVMPQPPEMFPPMSQPPSMFIPRDTLVPEMPLPQVPMPMPMLDIPLPRLEIPPQESIAGWTPSVSSTTPAFTLPEHVDKRKVPAPPLKTGLASFINTVPLPGMQPLTLPEMPTAPRMPQTMVQPLMSWEEFEADEYKLKYYYNRVTMQSVWEVPEKQCTIIRAKKVDIGSIDTWDSIESGKHSWARKDDYGAKVTDELTWDCPNYLVDLVKALDE